MTKTQWVALTPKQQWDVQVALRGPDCQHSEPIKWLTTSVLRWAMKDVMRVGGTLNDDLKIIITPGDPYTLDKLIRDGQKSKVMCWSPSHFFQHVIEAAYVCKIPVKWVPNKEYFEAVEEQYGPYSIAKLWEWASSQPDPPNPGYASQAKLTEELRRHLVEHFGHEPQALLDALKKQKERYPDAIG